MDLEQTDSGTVRSVRVGGVVTVRLPETATTAVRWQVPADLPGLTVLEDRTEPVPADPDDRRLGAPGVRLVRLAVDRPGTTRLRLVKRRAWETDVRDEFVVTLVASDPPA